MSDDMHPVMTLPRDPIGIAEITASAIRADARTAGALPLPSDALYFQDPPDGPNRLLSPAETAARGGGQCYNLVRAEGGFLGTHVGCVRTPIGFHVFLGFLRDGEEPLVYDVAKLKGMPGQPEYDGAAYAQIWQGPGGTIGPPGHDRPPAEISGVSLPGEAWADFVVTVGAPLVAQTDIDRALEDALASASGSRKEALRTILLVHRAATDPGLLEAIRLQLLGATSQGIPADAGRALGALGVLSGQPWRELVPRLPTRRAPFLRRRSYIGAAPLAPEALRFPQPKSCPGSCSIQRR